MNCSCPFIDTQTERDFGRELAVWYSHETKRFPIFVPLAKVETERLASLKILQDEEGFLWLKKVYLALPGSLAFLVPRTFFALFFLSFLCFLVEASFVARPFCTDTRTRKWRHHNVLWSVVRQESYPDKTVLGLELLCYSEVVVDETKSRAPSTTKLCLETKKEDCLGILDLVHLGQLLLHLGLGDVGATLMDQINNLLWKFGRWAINSFNRLHSVERICTYELLPLKEAIVHKLSGTDGALCHDGTGKEADGAGGEKKKGCADIFFPNQFSEGGWKEPKKILPVTSRGTTPLWAEVNKSEMQVSALYAQPRSSWLGIDGTTLALEFEFAQATVKLFLSWGIVFIRRCLHWIDLWNWSGAGEEAKIRQERRIRSEKGKRKYTGLRSLCQLAGESVHDKRTPPFPHQE